MTDILAPAGNYQKFIAGLLANADGFYLGLDKFSARGSAGNFSLSELKLALIAAKIHHKKIYIAINTLLHEDEIGEVFNLLSQLTNQPIAGIIIQDWGLINFLKESTPTLPIVASTQMSIHNLDGLLYLQKIGFDQVVPARELSFQEISQLKAKSKIKLEIFIHGALCFAYSGQCLMSVLIGARSGNRGECAQICRKKFSLDNQEFSHLLSPSDLHGADYVHKMEEIGIASLKIEGRMRSPQFVYSAVDYYKSILNKIPQAILEDKFNSLQISFNRGYKSGYLSGSSIGLVNNRKFSNEGLLFATVERIDADKVILKRISPYQLKKGDGIAIKTKNQTFGFILKEEATNLMDEIIIHEQINQFKDKSSIFVTSEARLDFLEKEPRIPLSISITQQNEILSINFPELNQKIEISLEEARSPQSFSQLLTKKITNFKHSYFRLILTTIEMNDNYLTAYSIVRDKITQLLDNLSDSINYNQPPKELVTKFKKRANIRPQQPSLDFIVDTLEILNHCQKERLEHTITDSLYKDIQKQKISLKEPCSLLLPPFFMDNLNELIDNLPTNITPIASNIGELSSISALNRDVKASWHLNVLNSYSADFIKKSGAIETALSLETNFSTFNFSQEINQSALLFGHTIAMTTKYCLITNNQNCSNCQQKHTLKDEKGSSFVVKTNSFCQNQIYSEKAIFLGEKYNKMVNYPLSRWYINLSNFPLKEQIFIISYFKTNLIQKSFGKEIGNVITKFYSGAYKL